MALGAKQVEIAVLVAAALLERHVMIDLITPRQPYISTVLTSELLLDGGAPTRHNPFAARTRGIVPTLASSAGKRFVFATVLAALAS